MRISPISSSTSIGSIGSISSSGAKAEVSESGGPSFKDAVKNAIKEVNHLQNQADTAATKMATGEIEDVHQAMIAMQKAKLALEFTIQVRNKVVESYQEIMRMQV